MPSSSTTSLEDAAAALADEVGVFDRADLLTCLGALQLLPINAARTFRLEALANVVALTHERGGKPRVSRHRLGQLCNSSPLMQLLAVHEDPFDNCLADEIVFYGGSYIVFPGILEHPLWTTEVLSTAIFKSTGLSGQVSFIERAYESTRAILALSNSVGTKCGLRRGTPPETSEHKTVHVPVQQDFEALKRAVEFRPDELRSLLEGNSLSSAALEPFILPRFEARADHFDPEEGPLHATPLVRTEDGWIIVPAPGAILAALRHFLLKLAEKVHLSDELATSFASAAWHRVKSSLSLLDHVQITGASVDSRDSCLWRGAFFAFDDDKVAYVQLVTDDLMGYGDKVFGSWLNVDLESLFLEKAGTAEAEAYASDSPPSEVFHIFLFDSPGRAALWGVREDSGLHSRLLMLTAPDLEAISLLDGGNPLALWQYAGAQERLREHTHVISMGQLDEYDVYRQRRSYYLSDDGKPTAMLMSPGGAGNVLRDVQRRHDKHTVPSFDLAGYEEVTRLEKSGTPIYMCFRQLGHRVCLLVEGLPHYVWIVSAHQPPPAQWSVYARLVDMLAYWIWQATTELNGPLATCRRMVALGIFVTVSEPDNWTGAIGDPFDRFETSRPVAEWRVDSDRIELNILPGLIPGLLRHDNAGERELLRVVFRAVRELASDFGDGPWQPWTDEEMESAVDRVAPLGDKKKLLLIDSTTNPEIDGRGLPHPRKIQAADSDELLDELGAFLATTLGLATGRIDDARRTSILNKVVKFYFDLLEREMRLLTAEGLLERLIANNEALTREVSFRNLTLPTRLACYAHEDELFGELVEKIPEFNSACLATRFLIEYVAASPPSGMRRPSVALLDRLTAIASEIVNWAFQSDLIYYGIFDLKLEMLGSGRLGVDRQAYLDDRERFLVNEVAVEVENARTHFESWWERREAKDSSLSAQVQSIDEAFVSEFAFGLSELVQFHYSTMAIGLEIDGAAKKMEQSTLVQRLTAELGWTTQRVELALSLMTLTPRASFLNPPTPFAKEDTYPWRFNRGLSLMRRPLVVVERDEGRTVYWGNHQVLASSKYLFQTFWSGRLRADHQKMKQIISRIRNRVSDDFAHHIANLFDGRDGLVVREKLKKVNKHFLGFPDENLGDIDVLVTDTRTRRLLLVEVKDLAVARTPSEMRREIQELVTGPDQGRSIIEKHQRREEWIRANLDSVLMEIGVPANGKWKVDALVVVDEDLLSPYLIDTALPVMSLRRFRLEFLTKWLK